MEQPKTRQFNVTIIFNENEEENQIAYRKAVKAILFNTENNENANTDK